jgi:hypothetical protein
MQQLGGHAIGAFHCPFSRFPRIIEPRADEAPCPHSFSPCPIDIAPSYPKL